MDALAVARQSPIRALLGRGPREPDQQRTDAPMRCAMMHVQQERRPVIEAGQARYEKSIHHLVEPEQALFLLSVAKHRRMARHDG
jgi:hypothetical protein